jgi:aryl sulfotransferase
MTAPTQPRTIVWIASYPKSGNTWVRFLVCNLVFGPIDSAVTLSRLAPDLHELRAIPGPPAQPTLMKTHFPYTGNLPLAAHTAGAIYVVRDPADVMLSNFHYARRSGASAAEVTDALDRYVDSYLDARGDPRWLKLGMGSWEENVRSWIGNKRDFPVVCVRYEDLLTEGVKVAGILCKCLGITRSPEEIAKAVDGACFRRMREIEEADISAQRVGIFYKPYLREPIEAGLRFMRAGRSGESFHVLSEEQRRRVDAVFGSIRRELGYAA